jgi:hypothetical protein
MLRHQVDFGDLMACRIDSDEQPLPRSIETVPLLRAGTRCGELREEEALLNATGGDAVSLTPPCMNRPNWTL